MRAVVLVALGTLAAMSPARAADGKGAAFGLTGLELALTEALALIALARLFVPIARRLGLGTEYVSARSASAISRSIDS